MSLCLGRLGGQLGRIVRRSLCWDRICILLDSQCSQVTELRFSLFNAHRRTGVARQRQKLVVWKKKRRQRGVTGVLRRLFEVKSVDLLEVGKIKTVVYEERHAVNNEQPQICRHIEGWRRCRAGYWCMHVKDRSDKRVGSSCVDEREPNMSRLKMSARRSSCRERILLVGGLVVREKVG